MPEGLGERLIELLFGDRETAQRASGALFQSRQWLAAIQLAVQWKMVPQFAESSSTAGLAPQETALLRRELLRAYGDTMRRATKALTGITALQAAGVQALVFKGLASMAVLYRDPRSRTIHDADLLVMPQDVGKAVACLEANGFSREGGGSLAEYTHFVDNSPGFAGNKAVTLYADGTEIDLHWELNGSGLRTADILERGRPAELLGRSIAVPHPADSLLLTIRHAVRENLAAGKICRNLMDVRLRSEALDREGELEIAMDRVSQAGGEVPALAVLGVLQVYHRTTAASRALQYLEPRVSRASRKSATRLAELFQYQLRHGALEKDVLYLVHSRPLRQIARGLSTSWSSYRRNMKALEQKLEQQADWTTRMAALLRSIPSPRTMKLARELARVKYGTD